MLEIGKSVELHHYDSTEVKGIILGYYELDNLSEDEDLENKIFDSNIGDDDFDEDDPVGYKKLPSCFVKSKEHIKDGGYILWIPSRKCFGVWYAQFCKPTNLKIAFNERLKMIKKMLNQ